MLWGERTRRELEELLDAMPERTRRKHERRFCVQCGVCADITEPAYGCCDRCGGPRYCSDACQRAHWVAGHQHDCGSATAAPGPAAVGAFTSLQDLLFGPVGGDEIRRQAFDMMRENPHLAIPPFLGRNGV